MTAIWVDGQAIVTLPVQDRGLAYGDGLFETIRVQQGQMPLLSFHRQRLTEGCQRLRLAADIELIITELLGHARLLGEGVLKLIVTRGDGMRGYAMPQPATVRRIVQPAALPAYPAQNAEQGIALFDCQTRLARQPLLAGLKHLNRLEQVLARSEWDDPAYAEGLLCDEQGDVIEGVFSNLFIVQQGSLITPDLSLAGVAGVMRAALLQAAAQQGFAVQVATVSRAQLLAADEVFFCNSLYGVWPVRALCDRTWPVGPATRKIQALAQGLMVGSCEA